MSSTDNSSSRVGLVISTTDSIRVFLSGASNDATLSPQLRQTSSDLLIQSELPYEPLRAVWIASHPSTRPDLTRLLSGTRFVFSSPKPREKVKPYFRFLTCYHYHYSFFLLFHNSYRSKYFFRFYFIFLVSKFVLDT